MKWLLYRAFARLVYHPRDSALFTAMRDYVDLRTLDERLHMMDEIMGDQPGHWGRFAMWIVWTSGWYPDRQAYQYFQIGPNLLIEGNNGTINTIGAHLLTYIADLRSRGPTYKRLIYHATTKTIELSPAFNWRFTNLNVAYDALRGFPARTLMVYSDVAASSIVGGQITDLLREIPYNRQEKGDMTIEPIHLQFQEIRSNIIETIEVHISEQNGKLVTFDSKKGASITLVFRNDIP